MNSIIIEYKEKNFETPFGEVIQYKLVKTFHIK